VETSLADDVVLSTALVTTCHDGVAAVTVCVCACVCVCVDFKFVACPPSLVAGACVAAAVTGLKGESWCRAMRLHRILRDVTSADTVSSRGASHLVSSKQADSLRV